LSKESNIARTEQLFFKENRYYQQITITGGELTKFFKYKLLYMKK